MQGFCILYYKQTKQAKAHKNTDFKIGRSPYIHQLKVHLAKITYLKPLSYRQTL